MKSSMVKWFEFASEVQNMKPLEYELYFDKSEVEIVDE